MKGILAYIGRRVLIFVITVFIAVSVVFFVPRLLPGDPLSAIYAKMAGVGGGAVSQELIAAYRQRFGLDQSTYQQYINFWDRLFHGDLGYSIASFPTHVSFLLRQALPWTIGLLTFTTLVSWLLGSLLGALVGWSNGKNRVLNTMVPIALVLYTTPYYILAIMLVFLLAYRWADLSAFRRLYTRRGQGMVVGVFHRRGAPCRAARAQHHSGLAGLVVPQHAQPDHLGAGTGLHPLGRSARPPQTAHFLGVCLPQCAAAADHRPGAVVRAYRRWRADHRGDLCLSRFGLCDLHRHPQSRFSGDPGDVLLLIISVSLANLLIDLIYPLIDPRIRFGGDSLIWPPRSRSSRFNRVVAVERRSVVSMLLENRKFVAGSAVFFGIADRRAGWRAVRRAGHAAHGRLSPQAWRPAFDPPGLWMGSTTLGQGVAIQWTQAVPNSILVGLIAATIGTVVGAIIGLVGGYFGGRIDAVLRIVVDVFLSIPSLLFLILIASLLKGVSVVEMALIIGAFAWAWPARAVRSQTLSLKERPFVRVAKLSGMGDLEIVLRELLPHLLPWLGANFLNAFIAAILAESALSIIGLGPATRDHPGHHDLLGPEFRRDDPEPLVVVAHPGDHPDGPLPLALPDPSGSGRSRQSASAPAELRTGSGVRGRAGPPCPATSAC